MTELNVETLKSFYRALVAHDLNQLSQWGGLLTFNDEYGFNLSIGHVTHPFAHLAVAAALKTEIEDGDPANWLHYRQLRDKLNSQAHLHLAALK